MVMKFIFSIREGIKVIIEAETLSEAQKEYQKVKSESVKIKKELIKVPKPKIKKKGMTEHILELKTEGFFDEPKTATEIKDKLSELAINKPLTSFPPYLNPLVQDRILKRTKRERDGKEVWTYENGN